MVVARSSFGGDMLCTFGFMNNVIFARNERSRMNEVKTRQGALLVLGWLTVCGRVGPIPSRYVTSQLGQLSLASLLGR